MGSIRYISYPGPPTSGTGEFEDLAVDNTGAIWVCTEAGSPGTWAAPAGGGSVDSVFGRTGVVVPQSGDYTVGEVTGAAPIASPTFTGTPGAPNPAHGTNNTEIATTAFVLAELPVYHALDYGIVADGSTDDTSAWNTLFATLITNGGGTIFAPPGKTTLCDSDLTPVPFVNFSAQSPPIRVTSGGGQMMGDTGFAPEGFIFDLRGTGNAKIDLRGTGYFEMDHVSIKSGGSDDTPFVFTANCVIYFHDIGFYGHSAHSGNQCVQDVFILGGTNIAHIQTGNTDAPYQAYGSVLERLSFGNVRSALVKGMFCNALVTRSFTFAASCGGDSTHGAITGAPGAGNAVANIHHDWLIEATHYPFPVVYGANCTDNKHFGFGIWDALTGCTETTTLTHGSASGTTLAVTSAGTIPAMTSGEVVTVVDSAGNQQQFTVSAAYAGGNGNLTITSASVTLNTGSGYTVLIGRATVSDNSANARNRFYGTYTSIPNDYPDTMSYQVVSGTATTNWVCTGPNGRYDVYAIGSGGGGGAGGTPSSALDKQVGGTGGAQGGVGLANLTLTNGTGYVTVIGAAAAATATTAAGGHAGQNGNGGNPSSIVVGSITVKGESGVPGTGGGASSTSDVTGGASVFFNNVLFGANAASNAGGGTTTADGWGGGTFNVISVSQAGGLPISRGAGGGGCGGNASTTNGGTAGSPGAFGAAAAGSRAGSANANGTDASAAAATSFGAGGGGGGAGATASGTGGKGGASGPGALIIIGPYPD